MGLCVAARWWHSGAARESQSVRGVVRSQTILAGLETAQGARSGAEMRRPAGRNKGVLS
jgi:hypothetical protein